MTNLKTHIEAAFSDIEKSETTDTISHRTLFLYPLEASLLTFAPTDSELDEFYKGHLYQMIGRLFELYWNQKVFVNQLDYVFRYSKADVVLIYLVNQLSDSNANTRWSFVVTCLEKLLIAYKRLPDAYLHLFEPSAISSNDVDNVDHFSKILINLPTRIANISNGSSKSELLNRKLFISTVLSAFTDNHCLFPFYGFLVSRLTLSGFMTEVGEYVLKDIISSSKVDNVDNCLWSFVLFHLKDRCIESFLLPILYHACHPRPIAILLGKLILSSESSKSKSVINVFRRFIFVRYFPHAFLLRNIFGSLCIIVMGNAPNDFSSKPIAKLINQKLGMPVLRLWADMTAIQGNSIEHRLYISQALCSWFGCFRDSTAVLDPLPDSALLPEILSGISNHLSSPREDIRTLGMAMGEWLMSRIKLSTQSSNAEPLKFSYEECDIVKRLRPFFKPIDLFDVNILDTTNLNVIDDQTPHYEATTELTEPISRDEKITSNTELDSDDDPDPFEESTESEMRPLSSIRTNESLLTDQHRPRYLRECLDGMLLSSKPEDNLISIACFKEAATLIRAHPHSARELVSQLAHVLIHIEPPASPDDRALLSNRHKALIALGVVAPKQCAHYLTAEFCQSTSCSFGQKQNIISAITDIACELTAGKPVSPASKLVSSTIQDSRFESKTRHFFKSRRPLSTVESKNMFAPVVGDYFFPLLQSIPKLYSTSQNDTFAHQDASLLANLIACLATMYACAHNAPIQKRMASELVETLPVLYRHSEPAVRRAVLIAAGTLITTSPDSMWMNNLDLFSLPQSPSGRHSGLAIPQWLLDCSSNETDSECQMLASVGLASLVERIAQLEL